jgi:hypothetical protein
LGRRGGGVGLHSATIWGYNAARRELPKKA